MSVIKKNVEAFNADVRANARYQYTSDSLYSAVVANRRITEATLERIGPDVETVLDLGCGDGTYTAEILRARPSLRIVGADAAQEAIAAARRRYSGVEFHTVDALELSTFPKGSFDLAIARGVLHHLSDPAKAIWNLTRSASRVLIIEPNGNNPLLKVIETVSRYHREHEERSFTARRIRRWCGEAQASVRSVSYIGFVPFYFPTLGARLIHGVQPLLERLPLLPNLFGAQIVITLESRR
jgi:ubiquinone/menaquinone biosynthesis C-methylase UbiE